MLPAFRCFLVLRVFALALSAFTGVQAQSNYVTSYTFSTLAGSAGILGSVDRTEITARFNFPNGVAVDNTGNIYVADSSNYTIRKITDGGVVTTLAGSAGNRGSADGIGSAARFSFPSSVAVDA